MADDGDSEGFKEQHHVLFLRVFVLDEPELRQILCHLIMESDDESWDGYGEFVKLASIKRVSFADNYETKPSPVPAMSSCNSQKPVLNRTTPSKDMYWFAQTSDPSAEETSPMKNNLFSKKEDGKEALLQKEREERVRLFKEQQEEERRKRQQELEQSFMVAKKYREQQEAERRRKIEEARIREDERRLQVEERKRQIWEAEQERKEAILRRNLEREARIEARRNAHKNSMSFAFGSSTPRTFDLDLAALGAGRGPAQGVLMSAVSGRRSEEREFGAKRATSACSLDRKFDEDSLYDDNSDISRDCSRESSLEPSPKVSLAKQIAIEHMKSDRTKACLTMLDDDDTSQSCGNVYFYSSPIPGWLRGSGALVEGEDLMSRSMVSLSSVSRGRRRTDLTPTIPRDRSTTPILISRGKQSLRAVSMTRLDQLAQPRRRFMEPPKDSTVISSPTKSKMISPSMSKSMCNLADSNIGSHSSRLTLHMPSARGDSSMSRSMMHLPDSVPHRGRTTSPRPSPTSPKPLSPSQPALRSAQSMTHLAITPRPTRATRLRANAVANAKDGRTASMLNLSKPEIYASGRLTMSVMKDNSQSPSRPQSSMSRTSEISTTSSQASGVMLRPKPAPRRPRPVSIAGTTVAGSSPAAPSLASKRPERPTRPTEKTAPKTARAKSAEPDQRSEEISKPRSAPKKPVPPPKTSEILAKAKSRPVPSKDNLRKHVASAEPAKKSAADSQTKNLAPSESEIKVLPSSEPEMKNVPSPEHEVKTPPSSEPQMKNLPSPEREVKPSSEPEVSNPVPIESEVKNLSPSESEIKSLTLAEPQVVPEIAGSVPCNEEQGTVDKLVAPDIENNESIVVSSDQPSSQECSEKETELLVDVTPSKPRITSEEEAKAALAEKRRLAREQAEREAELERQRQEELRRQEEERQRQEELEQKRLEEEQIRLAELHRKLEEEKLKKAIEEQQQREKEERERKEEEARLKAEKEEQERKAREEAERQRLELEERLRKEEEERAERKRRVEQIMSRTRARANQSSAVSQPNSQSASKATTPAEENKVSPPSDNPPVMNTTTVTTTTTTGISTPVQQEFSSVLINNDTTGDKCIDVSITTHENNISNKADSAETEILHPNSDNSGNHVEQLQNLKQNPVIENGHYKEIAEFPFEKTDVTLGMNHSANRTSECIDISLVAQTNGYSSHEEMSCTTSPEEKSETSDASGVGLAEVISQPCLAIHSEQSEFDQLIDLGQVEQSSNSHLDNYLINRDDLNSNIISPGKPFIAFEDISKKQETSVTDLLS